MEAFNDRSEQQISEDEIVYYMDFEHQFNALNNALYQYVKAEYREVIREHLENRIPWAVLAEKYSFSTRDLQRQWSRYRYGVAKELGYKVRTYASISR